MQCDWAALYNRRPCSVVLCETQLGLMDVQLLRRRSAQQTAVQPPDGTIGSSWGSAPAARLQPLPLPPATHHTSDVSLARLAYRYAIQRSSSPFFW